MERYEDRRDYRLALWPWLAAGDFEYRVLATAETRKHATPEQARRPMTVAFAAA